MQVGLKTIVGDKDFSMEGKKVEKVEGGVVGAGCKLVCEGRTVGRFDGDDNFSSKAAVVGEIEVVTVDGFEGGDDCSLEGAKVGDNEVVIEGGIVGTSEVAADGGAVGVSEIVAEGVTVGKFEGGNDC